MIVCHCNNVSHWVINQAIDEGATTLCALKKRCHVGVKCPGCKQACQELLDKKCKKNKDDS